MASFLQNKSNQDLHKMCHISKTKSFKDFILGANDIFSGTISRGVKLYDMCSKREFKLKARGSN